MTTTLFDGNLGSTPAAQGELTLQQILPPPLAPAVSETIQNSSVILDSDFNGDNTGYVGYTNYDIVSIVPPEVAPVNSDFPDLIPEDGFTLSFEVAVNSEQSAVPDARAGFSVIAVSSDGQSEIELSFAEDRIFAQADGFISGEEVAFDTTNATDYELVIEGSDYTLLADGTEILTGPLRNYDFDPSTNQPPLPFSPYDLPNFLFFGDNTDQASATFTLDSIEVDAGDEPNIPPPAVDDVASTEVETPVTIDVLANDVEPNGNEFQLADFQSVTAQGGEVLRINNGTPFDLTDDQLEYTPPDGFMGEDSFIYTISDGMSFDSAMVTVAVGSEPPPNPVDVKVTIENLAPEGGTFITPLWVGFQDGTFDIFDAGTPASLSLERVAEDGDVSFISEEFLSSGSGVVDGVLGDAPLAPGEMVMETFTLDSNDEASKYFSYAAMIVPSNDAFIANGEPERREVFDEDGNFVGFEFVVVAQQVKDAGTEVNDELPANTAFFGQETPNTGVDEDGVVMNHPGFNPVGSGGILDSEMFANADFTAEGYELARITVSLDTPIPIDDPVALTGVLTGDQEVPPVETEATGTVEMLLNEAGDAITYSLTVSGLDFGEFIGDGTPQTPETDDDVTGLHIHSAPRGENGPIVFGIINPNQDDDDVTFTLNDDGSTTISGIGEETDPANEPLSDFVEALRAAEPGEELPLYWNIHTEEFPMGEIRGQLQVEQEVVTNPTEVKVIIENLAPENGTNLTPFWVGFHDGVFDSYDPGAPVTPGLERLAEDGTTEVISQEFLDSGSGITDGTIGGGPIAPGEMVMETFLLSSTDETSRYFSYASMILPSNDAFVGNGNPTIHEIFDEEGNFIGAEFLILGDEVNDAGTEVNDELPENTAFFGQMTPDTGVEEGGVVTAHPGFNDVGTGGILDDPMFANADFTAEGYQIARVRVMLAGDNIDPVAIDDSAVTSENTLVEIEVLDNDSDIDGDPLILSIVTPPSNGTAEIDDDDIDYTPDEGFTGTDTFTYQIDDGNGGTDTATVTVTVEPDVPPELVEVKVIVENLAPENGTNLTPFWVGFHDGVFDSYDPGAPVTVGLERLAEDGTTEVISQEFLDSGSGVVDGTIGDAPIAPGTMVMDTFLLDSNDETSRYFSYASMILPSNDAFVGNGNPLVHEIFDEDGEFVGAEFLILGDEVNDAGTEINDELPENTAFFGQMTPNTGVDENGVVTAHPGFNPVGSGGILDDPMFAEADFTVEGYEIARVTVMLAGDNSDPVAVDDSAETEANTLVEVEVLDNDSDADGDPLTLSIVTAPSNGTAEIDDDDIDYTPDEGFTGTDTFTYQVDDGNGGTDTATVTVTVLPDVPPAPIEIKVIIENLAPENGTNLTPFWVGFHDGNFDSYDPGAPVTVGLERLAEDGTTEVISQEFLDSGSGVTDGTIGGAPIAPGTMVMDTFTLDSNDETSRYFSYASMILPSNDAFVANGNPLVHEIFDEDGEFVGAEFLILGDEVNDAGTEVNDELPENTAFFGQMTPNTGVDENGVVTAHPGFNPVGSGGILDDPMFANADFTAEGYQIARVTVMLAGDNSDPVAVDDSATTSIAETVEVDVLANDSDADGDPLTLSILISPNNGTAEVDDNGTPEDPTDDDIDYTPDEGFTGRDTFTYQVDDGNGGTDTATVTVTVSLIGSGLIVGTPGNDNLIGAAGADTIVALAGDDVLDGDFGSDRLLAGSGNDIINGGPGNDIINGGPGDDLINGGLGRDILIGGSDADTFVLPTNAAVSDISDADLILAFQPNFVNPAQPIDLIGLTGGLTEDDISLELTDDGSTAIAIAGSDQILGVVANTTPDLLVGRFISV